MTAVTKAKPERTRVKPQSDDWLSAVLATATRLERDLATEKVLLEVIEGLAGVARDFGAEMVTGASQIGDQLAGALVARSGGTLRLWVREGEPTTLLIIEGLLATGTQVARATRRAREAGAKRIVAAAVLADAAGLAAIRAQFGEEIVALGNVDLPAANVAQA